MTTGLHVRQSADGRSAWETATMPVPQALRPHVRSWIGCAERVAGAIRRREIPGPHVLMVFEFGQPLRVSACGSDACCHRHHGGFVAGLFDSFATTENEGYEASLQVNLTPLGARAILGLPLAETFRTVVELPDLLPATRGVSDRLASAASWDERFRVVELILVERLLAAASLRSDIVWAANQIETSGGLTRVGDLARALGMSRKHLNALFHDHVGMPPKGYASLVRFDGLAQRVWVSPEPSWADLALEAGFADQAHLAREVRRFSGLSPTALRAHLRELARFCPTDTFATARDVTFVQDVAWRTA
jgi:AraC-like DNA-binding protein